MNAARRFAVGLIVMFATSITVASADGSPPKPVRHLVYAFTYTNTSDLTVHDSGISNGDAGPGGAAPTSGIQDSFAGNSDKGEVTVDVMRVQPDSGLVVIVSEQARETRSAEPTTCVVYGNTNVICDPNKKINSEEFVLLRLLGTNFVDPAQIDSKNHWRVENTGQQIASVTDYSIGKNDAGIMHISGTWVLKQIGAQPFTTTTDGSIVYDFGRTLPTSIVEDATTREQRQMGQYNVVRTQTSLTLTTDSAAKKP
jgi:hypothetical protein